MGGLVGRAVFEGRLASFADIVLLGSFLHVGKNTSFGLGGYSVTSLKHHQ